VAHENLAYLGDRGQELAHLHRGEVHVHGARVASSGTMFQDLGQDPSVAAAIPSRLLLVLRRQAIDLPA
jgi:hypothetical protein